jgi:anti-anti-sigma factor
VQLAQVATDVIAGRAFLDEGLPVVDQVCTQTVELLVRPGGHADDITLLAVQRRPAPTAFHVHRPAEQGAPVTVRRGLHRWLAEIGASGDDQFALQHVVNELVANAVQHAYVNGSYDAAEARTIDVHGSLSAHGEVHLTVSDHGHWRARSEDPYRGRGLPLSSRLVDELLIDRRTDGTTVTVRHRLTGAAHLLNAERVASKANEPAAPDASMLLVLDQPVPPPEQPDDPSPRARIRLDGSIDLTTVEPLEQELLRRTTSGTHSITVDLTGVTHLASSGVAVLHELADRAERNGSELCLYAPVGSTAQQILSLVQLAHVTTDPDWPEPLP